jgi:hypothetical protein
MLSLDNLQELPCTLAILCLEQQSWSLIRKFILLDMRACTLRGTPSTINCLLS